VQLAVIQQLGAPIQELFAEFEPEARAAASLAQVHNLMLLCHALVLCSCSAMLPELNNETSFYFC